MFSKYTQSVTKLYLFFILVSTPVIAGAVVGSVAGVAIFTLIVIGLCHKKFGNIFSSAQTRFRNSHNRPMTESHEYEVPSMVQINNAYEVLSPRPESGSTGYEIPNNSLPYVSNQFYEPK